MMHWPNGIKEKSEYNELVQNINYAPTFLEMAEMDLKKAPSKMDGVSFRKVLRGSQKPVHDYLFFELGYALGVNTK